MLILLHFKQSVLTLWISLVLPSGHSVQELDMPPELAKALLEGNFSEAFQHYTLTKPTLSQT